MCAITVVSKQHDGSVWVSAKDTFQHCYQILVNIAEAFSVIVPDAGVNEGKSLHVLILVKKLGCVIKQGLVDGLKSNTDIPSLPRDLSLAVHLLHNMLQRPVQIPVQHSVYRSSSFTVAVIHQMSSYVTHLFHHAPEALGAWRKV